MIPQWLDVDWEKEAPEIVHGPLAHENGTPVEHTELHFAMATNDSEVSKTKFFYMAEDSSVDDHHHYLAFYERIKSGPYYKLIEAKPHLRILPANGEEFMLGLITLAASMARAA